MLFNVFEENYSLFASATEKRNYSLTSLHPKYWHFVLCESSNKSPVLPSPKRVKYSQMSAYALLDLYVPITIFNQASIILVVLLAVARKSIFLWQLQISAAINILVIKYLKLFSADLNGNSVCSKLCISSEKQTHKAYAKCVTSNEKFY